MALLVAMCWPKSAAALISDQPSHSLGRRAAPPEKMVIARSRKHREDAFGLREGGTRMHSLYSAATTLSPISEQDTRVSPSVQMSPVR